MSKAWMPLYVGDYLGDTAHLNQGQHGAYILLIMHYWQRGSLPSNKDECYCIARAMDEQSRTNVDKVLVQFFCSDGGVYKHARIDAELVKAAESYEKRVSAANARWDKAKQQHSKSNGAALQQQSQSQSYIEPIPSAETETDTPADLHPLNYATRLLQELGLPDTFGNREPVVASIRLHVANGKSVASAYEYLLATARDARDSGVEITKFWFEDSGRSANGNGKRNGTKRQTSPIEHRVSGNREVLADIARTIAAKRVGPDSDKLQDDSGAAVKRRVSARPV